MKDSTQQRDELAGILHGKGAYCGSCGYEDGACIGCNEVLDGYAEAILAAGYLKPQQISTVEELERLGRGATIVEPNGCVWVNDGQSEDPWGSFGEDPFGGPQWTDSSRITLPVTLVHRG